MAIDPLVDFVQVLDQRIVEDLVVFVLAPGNRSRQRLHESVDIATYFGRAEPPVGDHLLVAVKATQDAVVAEMEESVGIDFPNADCFP